MNRYPVFKRSGFSNRISMSYIKHWTTSSAWLTCSIGLNRVDQNSIEIVNSNIYCNSLQQLWEASLQISFIKWYDSFLESHFNPTDLVFLSLVPFHFEVCWCCQLCALRRSTTQLWYFAIAPVSSVENGTLQELWILTYTYTSDPFSMGQMDRKYFQTTKPQEMFFIPASTDYIDGYKEHL